MRRSSPSQNDRLIQTLHEEQRQIGLRFLPVIMSFNAIFAVLFGVLRIWPLSVLYMTAGLLYAWLLKTTKASDYQPRPVIVLWFWLIVFIESVCAVILLGPEPGFQFYLLGTIPASFASLNRPMRYKVFQALIIAVFFFLCDIRWLSGHMAPYALHPELNNLLRALNGFGLCAFLAWHSHTRANLIREAEDSLKQIASTDALTGLLNRRAITEIAEREAARSQRSHQPLSFLLCDIDHFKRINDTWGHAAGDHVLQNVAKLLQGTLREYDMVARWGGEEFLILLPDTNADTALKVGERLRTAIAQAELRFEAHAIPTTLTLGISQLDANENWHTTVSRADEALYRGKTGGRNRVEAG